MHTLCTYFSPSPLLLTPFLSSFLQPSLMDADMPSVKSILIYPRLCSALGFQTEFFSSPSFNFVSLYLRNTLLQKPWFFVHKNAEEEALGKQHLNIFQAAVGRIRDLTKLSGGFWHLTFSLPRTLTNSLHSATYFGASMRASKEFRNWEKWMRPTDNTFYLILKLQRGPWESSCTYAQCILIKSSVPA